MLKGIPILFDKFVKDHENEDDPKAFDEIVEKYIEDVKALMKNEDDSFLSDPKTEPIEVDDKTAEGDEKLKGHKVFLQRDWILTPETYLICPYCGEALSLLSSVLTRWMVSPYTDEKMMFFKCVCGKKTAVKVVV